MMTGTTPSGTPVRLSHEYVADAFWKMSDAIAHVAGMTANLGGMENVSAELTAVCERYRVLATKIENGAPDRAKNRAAVALERMMQD